MWTRRTPSSLPLIVGALHSLGRGALAPSGSAVTQRLAAPEPDGVLRLWIAPANGSPGLERAAAFHLFHPAVPAIENSTTFAKLKPAHDFYVDVMDGQRFPADDVNEPLPDPLQQGSVANYDPTGATTSAPTFGVPVAGELVAYAGFPKTGSFAVDGAFAVARVLSDTEAVAAIATLSAAGDEEGTIAYDAKAEMLIAGEGVDGMSGGGVFDAKGRLVGTLVRASTASTGSIGGQRYVRAVRTSFIATTLAAAPQSTSVVPYLPKP